jgi:hypothetical protein
VSRPHFDAPTESDELWATADVAAYFRVAAKTVRHWAKVGLLLPAFITPGGHRRYWKSAVIKAGQPQDGES